MKAMILAAGVGSRLRPLTDTVPKALIEIDRVPMLEITARRLQAAEVTELIVNAHHHAQMVADFCGGLARRLGLRIEVSREDDLLLDTGGGLKKASAFFDDGKPFLVHNADVLSDLDLAQLMAAHKKSRALATLVVRRRPTTRPLIFSKAGKLERRGKEGELGMQFCGIYAVSPRLFEKLTEDGVFSITDAFLRLAAEGASIKAFPFEGFWADIGDPEKLTRARKYALAHPETARPGQPPRTQPSPESH
jgi:NDP-sugar pyrophosphorylase family protein